jgi:hypothetical protein
MLRRALSSFCYVMLLVAGIAFTVTASGYAILTVRASPQYRRAVAGRPPSRTAAFLSRHGDRMLTAELAVLVGASLGAVAAHGRWRRHVDDTPKLRGAAAMASPPDAHGQAGREPPSVETGGARPSRSRALAEGGEPR